jgi:hypothetical protein
VPDQRRTSSTGGKKPDGTYTDPACTTGDPKDKRNEGLLVAKTGPTANVASATAELKQVKGTVVTELGDDIRKPTSSTDPRRSHCGAGAPRFDLSTSDGNSYFLGCDSPPADSQTRERLSAAPLGDGGPLTAFNAQTGALENISGKTLTSLEIVFDEGQDTGPDDFGLAVLDNVNLNGTLVGQGVHGHDD